jgi:N-glycosylase/DNA lyase
MHIKNDCLWKQSISLIQQIHADLKWFFQTGSAQIALTLRAAAPKLPLNQLFVKKLREPASVERIRNAHRKRRGEIARRLEEFDDVLRFGSDQRFWEEMVYCFFTAGCSARMGLRSIEAVRPLLRKGNRAQLAKVLSGVHRFPFARSRYIVESRAFLEEHCSMRIREKLLSFGDAIERRDWLVKEKRIKGLGYKEASHFLRNVGFRGYAILDKHVLQCMYELGLIEAPKPPTTRKRYLEVEKHLENFAKRIRINFNELDLVLWSLRTGEVLK